MIKPITQIPLQQLRPGNQANISCLQGCPHDVARFSELGLQRGAKVSIIRGGNTCILKLDGNCMCVRPSKQLTILVEPA